SSRNSFLCNYSHMQAVGQYTGEWRGGYPPNGGSSSPASHPLPAPELGGALLPERSHPLSAILAARRQRPGKGFQRRRSSIAGPAIDSLLGELDRQRCAPGDFSRQFLRPLHQCFGSDNLIDQPPVFGSAGIDPRTRKNHLLGPPRPNNPRQAL